MINPRPPFMKGDRDFLFPQPQIVDILDFNFNDVLRIRQFHGQGMKITGDIYVPPFPSWSKRRKWGSEQMVAVLPYGFRA